MTAVTFRKVFVRPFTTGITAAHFSLLLFIFSLKTSPAYKNVVLTSFRNGIRDKYELYFRPRTSVIIISSFIRLHGTGGFPAV